MVPGICNVIQSATFWWSHFVIRSLNMANQCWTFWHFSPKTNILRWICCLQLPTRAHKKRKEENHLIWSNNITSCLEGIKYQSEIGGCCNKKRTLKIKSISFHPRAQCPFWKTLLPSRKSPVGHNSSVRIYEIGWRPKSITMLSPSEHASYKILEMHIVHLKHAHSTNDDKNRKKALCILKEVRARGVRMQLNSNTIAFV